MSYSPKSKTTISILEDIQPVQERTVHMLQITLEKIKFLETIYITGGENYRYSEDFSDAAHTERQDLCKVSSWLYSRLRDTFSMTDNETDEALKNL